MVATRQRRNKSDGDDGLISGKRSKIKIFIICCFTAIFIFFSEFFMIIFITVSATQNIKFSNYDRSPNLRRNSLARCLNAAV